MQVGIEAINAYCGQTSLNVYKLFEARGLDIERFDNFMMQEKSVNVPCEDPVTNGVNAAKPIIDGLSSEAKNRIEMVITASESGLDFGKSLSTYIHEHLGLSRHCRLFEVKQACYGGIAALQMAISFVAAKLSLGAKVLVIATDVARAAAKMTYAEPSQGVAAVAMLVSDNPTIFEADLGANGYYSYEVMDTCRPEPEIETGDPDLSLMSYLDCLEGSYEAYQNKVEGTDIQNTFSHLVFHTPFGGMAKGAHRKLMRKYKPTINPQAIDEDFNLRVAPSLRYTARVGNVYSASVYLAFCGLLDTIDLPFAKRIGLYSYGSGCSSEFYSGIIHPTAKAKLQSFAIKQAIDNRYPLTIESYDRLLDLHMEWLFSIKNKEVNVSSFADIYERQFAGKGLLVLKRINNYHREYDWS